MSDKPSFFADLKRRSVIPIDYADDSISLPDLPTRELHRTIFTSVSSKLIGPLGNFVGQNRNQ
jgi:hypothetical protein